MIWSLRVESSENETTFDEVNLGLRSAIISAPWNPGKLAVPHLVAYRADMSRTLYSRVLPNEEMLGQMSNSPIELSMALRGTFALLHQFNRAEKDEVISCLGSDELWVLSK